MYAYTNNMKIDEERKYMHEEYVKETKIIDKKEAEKRQELIISIIRTKRELEEANRNFEFAQDELIDYYLYNMKANQAKLDYLIKKAKAHGISLDRINEIDIRKNKVV